jgi:hypothetical protein
MDPADITKLFENDAGSFEERALSVFYFQYENNPLYRDYCNLLRKGVKPASLIEIPFLPINFFKTHPVKTSVFEPEIIFESSGTTGMERSVHYVRSASLYEKSFLQGFEFTYGDPSSYCFLGLLPSYLERSDSSLIYMVQKLMEKSGHASNGFFLNNQQELYDRLEKLEAANQKTILFSVSYALLDFATAFPMVLNHTIVMETGGMKGRKKEILRTELHELVKKAFSIREVHSEYGMTELLSQAYAKGDGIFQPAATMKVLIREEDDPGAVYAETKIPKQGGINVIDLANIYSCSFIETEDIGKLYPDGSFEVAGRLDHSDIRGCSLMVV